MDQELERFKNIGSLTNEYSLLNDMWSKWSISLPVQETNYAFLKVMRSLTENVQLDVDQNINAFGKEGIKGRLSELNNKILRNIELYQSNKDKFLNFDYPSLIPNRLSAIERPWRGQVLEDLREERLQNLISPSSLNKDLYTPIYEHSLTLKTYLGRFFDNPPLDNQSDTPLGNKFNDQPIKEVRQHFKTLTVLKSKKNKKPILSEEQFESFISRAFTGQKDVSKIEMNRGSKDGRNIQKIFLSYYHKYFQIYPRTNNNQKEYLKLLTDNFADWDFDTLEQNFHKCK